METSLLMKLQHSNESNSVFSSQNKDLIKTNHKLLCKAGTMKNTHQEQIVRQKMICCDKCTPLC